CFTAAYVPPFFFNRTPTSAIYPLSLHDALPISCRLAAHQAQASAMRAAHQLDVETLFQGLDPAMDEAHAGIRLAGGDGLEQLVRSEEHTSELQSRENLVCRLLLEKKKTQHQQQT